MNILNQYLYEILSSGFTCTCTLLRNTLFSYQQWRSRLPPPPLPQTLPLPSAMSISSQQLPWFNKTLNAATTDYLEMRVCVDQGTHTEDIKLTFYELYVK